MAPVTSIAIRNMLTELGRSETELMEAVSGEPVPATLADHSGLKVLVADDNAINREVISHALRRFRITPNGLVVHSTGHPQDVPSSVGLYLRTEDIPMPQPLAVEIEDLNWLTGVWVGARGRTGTTAIEERWIPPAGGAMLGLSRTVSAGKMSGFEYMRIVERGEGIVYIAQPGGWATDRIRAYRVGRPACGLRKSTA